ncbi:MAG: phosphatidylserine decarboxylase [Leptospiraceae bacterium]|nr:phosphatidylserine decarboxylase [Leptospiraceae bacterium]
MLGLEAYLSVAVLTLLIVTSVLYTLYLRFLPLRYVFYGFRIALTGLGKEDEGSTIPKTQRAGEINNLRAMFLAGSIQANTAVLLGIPVIVLWGGAASLVWVALFGILLGTLRFASGTLAVRYREKREHEFLGGAREIITTTFWGKTGGMLYAFLAIAVCIVWGATAQADLWQKFYVNPDKVSQPLKLGEHLFSSAWAPTFIVLTGFLLSLGSLRRIGRIAAFITPIVTTLLLILAIYIIAQNSAKASLFLSQAFSQALNFKSLAAGIVTSILVFKCAVFAGIVAPEESTGISSAVTAASVNDYAVKQGLVSMSTALFYTTIFIPLLCLAYAVGMPEVKGADMAIGGVKSLLAPTPAAASEILRQVQYSLAHIFSGSLGRGGFLIIALSAFALGAIAAAVWIVILERLLSSLGLRGAIWPARIVFVAAFALSPQFSNLSDKVLVSSVLFSLIAMIFLTALLTKLREVRLLAREYFELYPHKHDLAVKFYVLLLTLLPKNMVSKLNGFLAGLRLPRFMMTPIVLAFARIYKINIQEAELEIRDYESLNKFFTRALKNGSRLIDQKETVIVSPVDGRLLVSGSLEKGQLLQSKGMESSLQNLLGNNRFYKQFLGGHYMTIYLSPQDYHRIHSPVEGRILGYYYQPGKLFPVNNLAVNSINQLFSKNERLITYIQSDRGLVALIKVGATSVGKIRVTYDPNIATNRWIRLAKEHMYDEEIFIRKGAELGRFEMGSTVMLLFEKDTVELLDFEEKQKMLLGQPIALFTGNSGTGSKKAIKPSAKAAAKKERS